MNPSGSNTNKAPISPELQDAGSDLRNKIALKRQWVGAIIDDPLSIPPEKSLTLDFDSPSIEQVVEEARNATPLSSEDIEYLMSELDAMERDLSKTIPGLAAMPLETREAIVSDIAFQEYNWDILKASEIIVSKDEMKMWGSFLKTAKKVDFIEQRVVETLKSGEILELTIDGFQTFHIIKIRAKNKDVCAMSVIEFEKQDPKTMKIVHAGGDFLITLPLIEGVSFSILKKDTTEALVSYKIKKMRINREHRTVIQKFFDLLAGVKKPS